MKWWSHTNQAAAHLNSDNVRTVDEILVPFSTNPVWFLFGTRPEGYLEPDLCSNLILQNSVQK